MLLHRFLTVWATQKSNRKEIQCKLTKHLRLSSGSGKSNENSSLAAAVLQLCPAPAPVSTRLLPSPTAILSLHFRSSILTGFLQDSLTRLLCDRYSAIAVILDKVDAAAEHQETTATYQNRLRTSVLVRPKTTSRLQYTRKAVAWCRRENVSLENIQRLVLIQWREQSYTMIAFRHQQKPVWAMMIIQSGGYAP